VAGSAKKFTSMESQFDVVVEDLFNASIKLEEKEKVNVFAMSQNPYKRRISFSEICLRNIRIFGKIHFLEK
jgi:hypothetical protein